LAIHLFEWVEAFDVVVLVEAVAMLDLTAWEVPSTVVAPLALVVVVAAAVAVGAVVVGVGLGAGVGVGGVVWWVWCGVVWCVKLY